MESSDLHDSIFCLEYEYSVTPLLKAAKEGNLKNIRKLLSNGSLPQTPDNRGWTAIHHCAAGNHIKALQLILKVKFKSKKYLANLTTWENWTPLLLALKASPPSFKMIKILLKAGASPNITTYTKMSPLHLACLKKKTLSIVKLLVQFGADVNIQEELSMFSPLHFAVCESQDLEVIQYLIDISDLTIKDSKNETAFIKACRLNFLSAVQLFLEKDKSLPNTEAPILPLVYAVHLGNLEMTQLLIKSGANVNSRCKAIVSCEFDETLLTSKYYLPIFSSLTNVDIFKLLLSLTSHKEILSLDTGFCTFPLFVLMYGRSADFYETLLQAPVADNLKTFSCRIFINFLLESLDKSDSLGQKFLLFFKYNFYSEPENVFQNFVCLQAIDELCENYKFIYMLAQMGISSGDELENKSYVIGCLQNCIKEQKNLVDIEKIKATCNLLSVSVLSLKQYSRVAARRYIRTVAGSDWLAVNTVNNSSLPDVLKRYLFFQDISV